MAIAFTNVLILLLRLNNVAYMPAIALTEMASMSAFGAKVAWRLRRAALFQQVIVILSIFLLGAFVWFTSIDRSNAPLYRSIFEKMSSSPSGWASLPISALRHFHKELSV